MITLDIALATGLILIMMTGVMTLSFSDQRVVLDGALHRSTLFDAHTLLKKEVSLLAQQWHTYDPKDATYASSSPLRVTASSISPCLKEILVQTTVGKTSFATLIASIEEIAFLGGDCPIIIFSTSTQPSSAQLPVGAIPAVQSTDMDIVERPDGRFVFIATKNPATKLVVFDLTDTSRELPHYTHRGTGGFFAVDATSQYIFAVGATTTTQTPLQIFTFDQNNDPSIRLVASSALPDTNSGIGKSVYFYHKKVFVGTQYVPCVTCAPEKNNEFHIFDVTIPEKPLWEGSFDVDRNVNDIAVRGNLAYLATGPGADNTILKIYDIQDPSAIKPVGSYMAPNAKQAKSLYLLDTYLYLGRERSSGIYPDFIVLDVSDPAHPFMTDALHLDLGFEATIEDIVVHDNTAFLAIGGHNPPQKGGAVFLVDIHDPYNIATMHPCNITPSPKDTIGVDIAEEYLLFVSTQTNILHARYPPFIC